MTGNEAKGQVVVCDWTIGIEVIALYVDLVWDIFVFIALTRWQPVLNRGTRTGLFAAGNRKNFSALSRDCQAGNVRVFFEDSQEKRVDIGVIGR